jgi:hypothetical protein
MLRKMSHQPAVRLIATLVVAAGLILATASPANASCMSECLADPNNTPGECNAACGNSFGSFSSDETFDPLKGPTAKTLDTVNPLKVAESELADQLTTPGAIVSRLLSFSFPISGIILFVMLVWGGFEVQMGSVNKKSADAGKQRITASLVGFLLLFCSYWIAQIIEYVFGISILG